MNLGEIIQGLGSALAVGLSLYAIWRKERRIDEEVDDKKDSSLGRTFKNLWEKGKDEWAKRESGYVTQTTTLQAQLTDAREKLARMEERIKSLEEDKGWLENRILHLESQAKNG